MWRVFGYTDDCKDFELYFDNEEEAIIKYNDLDKWCVVFIEVV